MIELDFNKFIHKIFLRFIANLREANSTTANFSFQILVEVNLLQRKIWTIWVNLKKKWNLEWIESRKIRAIWLSVRHREYRCWGREELEKMSLLNLTIFRAFFGSSDFSGNVDTESATPQSEYIYQTFVGTSKSRVVDLYVIDSFDIFSYDILKAAFVKSYTISLFISAENDSSLQSPFTKFWCYQ